MLQLRAMCLTGAILYFHPALASKACVIENSSYTPPSNLQMCFNFCWPLPPMLPAVYTVPTREKHKWTEFVNVYNHRII